MRAGHSREPMSELTETAAALNDRYRKQFAGKSRATRDLAVLDALIADTQAFLPALAQSLSLRTEVEERLATYLKEREAIAAIQAGGPEAIAAWRVAEWSEVGHYRYRREYGGRNRLTCDPWLLEEMAAEERAAVGTIAPIAARLAEPTLNGRLDAMKKDAALYAEEAGKIHQARKAQRPVDRISTLATAANRQFELYRRHFQGKLRASRRPALLERLIAALSAVQAEMEAARAAGVTLPQHAENIRKVAGRIEHHREELAKVAQDRTNTPTAQLVGQLGDDANRWIARYRDEFAGKPRAGRDLDALSEICDGLHEVGRAMRELGTVDAVNEKNIGVVLEHLKTAEREFSAIREANRPARAPAAGN